MSRSIGMPSREDGSAGEGRVICATGSATFRDLLALVRMVGRLERSPV